MTEHRKESLCIATFVLTLVGCLYWTLGGPAERYFKKRSQANYATNGPYYPIWRSYIDPGFARHYPYEPMSPARTDQFWTKREYLYLASKAEMTKIGLNPAQYQALTWQQYWHWYRDI